MSAHPVMSLPILDDVLVEVECPGCGAAGDVYVEPGDSLMPLCECRECGLVWVEEGAAVRAGAESRAVVGATREAVSHGAHGEHGYGEICDKEDA